MNSFANETHMRVSSLLHCHLHSPFNASTCHAVPGLAYCSNPVPVVTVVLRLILDPGNIAETFTAANLDSSSSVGGCTAIAGHELV